MLEWGRAVIPAGLRRRLSGTLGIGLASVAVTAIVAPALLLLGGYDPLLAGAAMVRGSVGGWDVITSFTLVRSVPLILTGLAVALAFRAGVWNIGAEGQLYAGAIAAVWVGLNGAALPAWALAPSVLVAAALAGGVWALVPALMRLRLGVGEVITTILMNFVALNLVAYMVQGPLQESRGVFPQTDQIVEAARLPALIADTRLHVGFALAVVLGVGLSLVLRRSRFGFHLRAVGASPEAARISGGIDADKVAFGSFLGSGAIAGLAGGVQVAGVTYTLQEGLSQGWGYTAIAVALLAGLNPLGVMVTGVFFGALQAGSGAMQRDAGIPSAWVGVVEALVILAVLAIGRASRQGTRGGAS